MQSRRLHAGHTTTNIRRNSIARRSLIVHAALILGEAVAFIVGDQVDDGSLEQRSWLIEDQTAVLDRGAEGAHGGYRRAFGGEWQALRQPRAMPRSA